METLTVGCLRILLLMPLDSAKYLNLLALWEGKRHFKLNDGTNQTNFWATSFHGGDGRAWAACLPKHWAAFGTGDSLVKIYGLASQGISILDKYAEAVHCMTEDKAPKHFLFMQAFEDLSKWNIFTCPPAISSHWHAVSLLPVPWRYLHGGRYLHGATAHCGSQHNSSQEQSLTFWETKGKQTPKPQTTEPGQKKSYLDLASALIALAYKVNQRESHGNLVWTERSI